MIRRWIIAFALLLQLPVFCLAAEGRGYIRLTMAYGGKPVVGGTVAIFEISNCPVEQNPAELVDYVKEKNIPGKEITVDSEGVVLFDALLPGYYLLVQPRAAAGFLPMKPFCIRLNEGPNGAVAEGIDAAPKMEPEKTLPQTGQLVWPAWGLLGTGLFIAGIGLFIQKRK